MNDQRQWYAGVDWGSQSHCVFLTDGEGRKIETRRLAQRSHRQLGRHRHTSHAGTTGGSTHARTHLTFGRGQWVTYDTSLFK
jgi:hypothetical protein